MTQEHEEPTGASGGSLAWIPVTERLPEEGERVLAWDNGFKESEMATYYARDGWGGEVIASLNVTHWMPLPAPPTSSK